MNCAWRYTFITTSRLSVAAEGGKGGEKNSYDNNNNDSSQKKDPSLAK